VCAAQGSRCSQVTRAALATGEEDSTLHIILLARLREIKTNLKRTTRLYLIMPCRVSQSLATWSTPDGLGSLFFFFFLLQLDQNRLDTSHPRATSSFIAAPDPLQFDGRRAPGCGNGWPWHTAANSGPGKWRSSSLEPSPCRSLRPDLSAACWPLFRLADPLRSATISLDEWRQHPSLLGLPCHQALFDAVPRG